MFLIKQNIYTPSFLAVKVNLYNDTFTSSILWSPETYFYRFVPRNCCQNYIFNCINKFSVSLTRTTLVPSFATCSACRCLEWTLCSTVIHMSNLSILFSVLYSSACLTAIIGSPIVKFFRNCNRSPTSVFATPKTSLSWISSSFRTS